MRDKHGNTINIDQEATNELLKRLEIPNGNTGLLDYVRMRLKEQENRKKDLTEEDVLSRSTVEGSYTDDSTGGLDLPSTGPVRGTTPSPGRRGATPSPGRSNQPKLSDQLLGPRPGRISAFVDPNDSTIYKVEEDLEQSVLLRNTDLAPKAASQRDPEEIARVYAEVRRLKALVSLKETALKDLQETAEDWDKKFLNIERSKDSMHSEFDRTMSVLVDERDKLEADLERVRAEFREAKDTKDREIRALKEQVRAQQADIYQLEEEASQVKAVQPKRDTVRENKLSDEIEDLVAQLVEEKNKTRLMESRILNYAESQAKHLNELADIQQELKSLKELLAEKDEENDRLGKFIFDLEDTLEAAAAADKASTTAPAVTKKPATAGITQNPGDFGMGSESSGVRYEESPEYVRGPFEDSPSRIPAGIRRKQSIDHTVYMHWAGREVQTDIEIPPGEERLVSGCVAWLQDPTLAAINELKQQIPEVVEEASSNDAECQTAEAWPKPITVEEEIQRQQAEMEDYGIQRRQAETEDHGTQAELAPTESAVPASYPEDHYQETIITDNATRTLLYDLTMKSELTLADRAFLNDFVMKQSTSPNREILHNVWRLAQPAARALRMAAAKTYDGSSAAGYIFKFHRIHGPMGVFAWPLRLLWDAFHGLDQADYYASTNPRGGNEQAALDSNNLSTESADSAANPQPKPKSAPRGRQATLLRAGPWPGLAWSILTAGLYLFILILLLSNLHMYRSMKQEQNLWVRANEPSPARFTNPGFRRVCHSSNGWGWRWRELIMVWVNEQGRSWPA
ncbi:hypothetical protein BZA05DRAFT_203135 [Tricharina praecox]|uniref:uncharacterized protein n=1 Tax=Tricharina praecox TaxID=43433 RepID=UPI00221E5A01|nr:uncharacterized protein BZA05DRAFT_203135 [Tricharina praecox]KAI5856504.1 hypothetical protein BZA05DRAFT_203135 [Tricharina praecox]